MRKGQIYSLLSLISITVLISGCTGGGQSRDYMEENDSVMIYTPDTAFYGHLGESTGMSSIELITDSGDTLSLNKTNEKTGGQGSIIGEIANYTDYFSVTTCDNNQSVDVALNVTQLLQRKWQSDTDRRHGIFLEANGKARPLSAEQYKYNMWSLCNCKLILLRESEGEHGAETRNDTLNILYLSPDSLTLQCTRDSISERFHRI